MKKKLISVLAALMVLTMGTTVFAGSPVTDEQKEMNTTVTVDGKEVAAVPAPVEAIEAAKDVAKEAKGELKAVTDLPKELVGVEVKVELDVKSGDKVAVYHWNGKSWDLVDTVKAHKGYVLATFDELSPVAFVKVKSASKPAPAPAETPADATTSPKTGAAAGAAAVAMLGLAGAAVCKRKDK